MIASLKGIVQAKSLDNVVIDVNGVGYRLHVSAQTLAEMPAETEQAAIRCYTHVREDALQLFGFSSEAEQQAFELLIAVSGVGPKLALTILSGMPVSELTRAISDGNHARLQAVPGVGKKTAERLVVELKDRFTKIKITTRAGEAPDVDASTEVVEALVNLGYKRAQADRAVKHLAQSEATLPPEETLRKALAVIAEL